MMFGVRRLRIVVTQVKEGIREIGYNTEPMYSTYMFISTVNSCVAVPQNLIRRTYLALLEGRSFLARQVEVSFGPRVTLFFAPIFDFPSSQLGMQIIH